jgi:hypothetical protein
MHFAALPRLRARAAAVAARRLALFGSAGLGTRFHLLSKGNEGTTRDASSSSPSSSFSSSSSPSHSAAEDADLHRALADIKARVTELEKGSTAASLLYAKVEAAEEAAERLRGNSRAAFRFVRSTLVVAGGIVAVVGGVLIIDHVICSYKPYVRRRIRKALLAGPKKILSRINDHDFFPELWPPLRMSTSRSHAATAAPTYSSLSPDLSPLVVLAGPSGTGKTMALANLAGKLKSEEDKVRAPVAYLHFLPGAPFQNDSISANIELNFALRTVVEGIDYPERPSVLSRLYWRWWRAVPAEDDPFTPERYLQSAITDLLGACWELEKERRDDESIPANRRRPILLLDNPHPLLVARLHAAVDDACEYGRWHRFWARVVVAESGSDFLAVQKTHRTGRRSKMSEWEYENWVHMPWEVEKKYREMGPQVTVLTQGDPAESAVRERLLAVGNTKQEADALIEAMGTRMRLIHDVLMTKLSGMKVVDARADQIKGDIHCLFRECKGDARRIDELAAIMDALSESPSSTLPLEKIPAWLLDGDPPSESIFSNHLFFVHPHDRTVALDNQFFQRLWRKTRSEYLWKRQDG